MDTHNTFETNGKMAKSAKSVFWMNLNRKCLLKKIEEIVYTQQETVANYNVLKQIDKEMQDTEKEVSDDTVQTIKVKRCRYFNVGFC